jgi:hypothetical protein
LVYISSFGNLHQEKSGSPGRQRCRANFDTVVVAAVTWLDALKIHFYSRPPPPPLLLQMGKKGKAAKKKVFVF